MFLKRVGENTSVFTPNRDTCSHLVEVKEVVAFATAMKHNGLNNKWLKMPPGISWLRGSQTHRAGRTQADKKRRSFGSSN